MQPRLVLSVFPGIDLLGRAFDEVFGAEICLVRGPDVLFGGDIRTFHVPAGPWFGVIGGPPCQRFSALANIVRARYGEQALTDNLIPEFERVVAEGQPEWFLMENVPRAPEPVISGYSVHSLLFDNHWLGVEQQRIRRFSFGTHHRARLDPDVVCLENPIRERAVMATRRGGGAGLKFDRNATMRPAATLERTRRASARDLARVCELQGLPIDFLADKTVPFTIDGKHRLVGNGVPMPMGRAIAKAVRRALEAAPCR